jgi:hypothetical protein
MADTMNGMELKSVDVLTAGQLEVDDMITVNDEIVNIVEIVSLPDGYTIEVVNDFGEREVIQVEEYQQFNLMMFLDDIDE